MPDWKRVSRHYYDCDVSALNSGVQGKVSLRVLYFPLSDTFYLVEPHPDPSRGFEVGTITGTFPGVKSLVKADAQHGG